MGGACLAPRPAPNQELLVHRAALLRRPHRPDVEACADRAARGGAEDHADCVPTLGILGNRELEAHHLARLIVEEGLGRDNLPADENLVVAADRLASPAGDPEDGGLVGRHLQQVGELAWAPEDAPAEAPLESSRLAACLLQVMGGLVRLDPGLRTIDRPRIERRDPLRFIPCAP